MADCFISSIPSVRYMVTERLSCALGKVSDSFLKEDGSSRYREGFFFFFDRNPSLAENVDLDFFFQELLLCREKRIFRFVSVSCVFPLSDYEKKFLEKLSHHVDYIVYDPEKLPVDQWQEGIDALLQISRKIAVFASCVEESEEFYKEKWIAKTVFDVGKKGIVFIRGSNAFSRKVLDILESHPFSEGCGKVFLYPTDFSLKNLHNYAFEKMRNICVGICFPEALSILGFPAKTIFSEMVCGKKTVLSVLRKLRVPFPDLFLEIEKYKEDLTVRKQAGESQQELLKMLEKYERQTVGTDCMASYRKQIEQLLENSTKKNSSQSFFAFR